MRSQSYHYAQEHLATGEAQRRERIRLDVRPSMNLLTFYL
jgi:hypothetical protein